jgi:hypothetical protein
MRSPERKMSDRTLAERVEILEQSVRILAMLPSRVSAVETQILQLRSEVQAEFSAIREEFRHDIRTGLRRCAWK